jgi:hypothetical protein
MPKLSLAAPQRKAERPLHPELDAALKRGWSILPVGLTKRPLVNSWRQFQSEPPKAAQVDQWQRTFAPPAWAVITGKTSGVIILDFDGPEGAAQLERLKLDPHVRTGSGGHHVYFRYPGWPVSTLNSKSSSQRLSDYKGIDIRGDGGYAVFAGRNDVGEYRRLRNLDVLAEVQEIPDEKLRRLLGLVPPPVEGTSGSERVTADLLISRALDSVRNGKGRNESGLWLACQLRDNGYSESEARAAGPAYIARCPGTNAKGKAELYSSGEWEASVRQAYSTPPREPWSKQKKVVNSTAVAPPPEPATPVVAPVPIELERRPEAAEQTIYDGKSTYVSTNNGLVWWRPTREGSRKGERITNFDARIVADLVLDDGAERNRAFKIEARRAGRTQTINVRSADFAAMNWPTELLGAAYNVTSNMKDRARDAIQNLSIIDGIAERIVYRHIGWREIDGQWIYLHAGGALGAAGVLDGIEIELQGNLQHYVLPAPPVGEVRTSAIRTSLQMLTVAPHAVVAPIYAAIWRSVLGPSSFALHISGKTGQGKSQLAALAQQHFGAVMEAQRLPASWSGTANALEAIAFEAKDALLTIDEFVPSGSAQDVQGLHAKAERVLRSQGNNAGRLRLRADTTLRPEKSPRGLIVSTGEDVPKGNSLRARMVILDLPTGSMNWEALSECQAAAQQGIYAQALSAFLQWVAPQMPTMQARIQREVTAVRASTVNAAHRRTPDNLMNLTIGLRLFLEFAQECGDVSGREAEVIWGLASEAMHDAIRQQEQQQRQSDPASLYIELLAGVLTSGRGHIARLDGTTPPRAGSFGWQQSGNNADFVPRGERIGWTDDSGTSLYLEPRAAFAAVSAMGRESGDPIPFSLIVVNKRLKDKGLLATIDAATGTLTVRKKVEGEQRSVLHLNASVLSLGTNSSISSIDADAPPEMLGNAAGKTVLPRRLRQNPAPVTHSDT